MARPTMIMGYPVVYVRNGHTVLCGDHAEDTDVQHPLWEGPGIQCDHEDDCETVIESAYGEVES